MKLVSDHFLALVDMESYCEDGFGVVLTKEVDDRRLGACKGRSERKFWYGSGERMTNSSDTMFAGMGIYTVIVGGNLRSSLYYADILWHTAINIK